jgi:uncharacterized protein DUF6931
MSRVRFATAQALFETFPASVTGLTVTPTDEPPVAFLRNLSAAEKLEDAVTFCAYLLPRREAVWWACESVKALLGNVGATGTASLRAAETWVRDPSEQHRLAALEIGGRGNSDDPWTWLALGAGWSGGMLSAHPKMPAPTPQYLTPGAARIAILLSAHSLAPEERTPRMRGRIAEGIKLAEGGP